MMRSWMDLFCIPVRLARSSRAKRSNVNTIREILAFISKADTETNAIVKIIIRRFLTELLASHDITRPCSLLDDDTTDPLVDRCILSDLATALKQNSSASTQNNTSSRILPVRLCEGEPEERGGAHHTSPPDDLHHRTSVRDQSWVYAALSQCTTAQLELLFQLEAVRNWSALLRASQLDCTVELPGLPAMLPRPCSNSTGGRVRVASWNLNRFTLDKAEHPGFREALCLTVLRARISLLVLQEVASLDVVNVICTELNNPTLPHVKQWLARNPPSCVACWEAATSIQSTGTMFRGAEYAAFLYDFNAGIRIKRTHLLEPKRSDENATVPRTSRSFSRSPCPALCKLRNERFIIVSVHLKARGLRNSRIGQTAAEVQALEVLVQAFKDTQPTGTHLIIIGDFNLNPDHEAFSGLRNAGMLSILKGDQSTTVSTIPKEESTAASVANPTSSRPCHTAYDNAWLSSHLTTKNDSSSAFYTGDCGVITHGLRHPLIPNTTGASANGFISDHCPIWFDLLIP